jgi:fructokinase
MSDASRDIVCVGEMLWDSVPRGLLPGGAPMNLAYHLSRLGWRPWLVSSVGHDVLGDELLRRLHGWQLETALIHVHPTRPTGLVRVELAAGMPRYDILEGVAWDEIPLPREWPASLATPRALVFGSLAQRSACNRATLAALLERHHSTLKVFDVNLRAPYDGIPQVLALARRADLVKVNEEELARLLDREVPRSALEPAARLLALRIGCTCLCVTAGAYGAGMLRREAWTWMDAAPVEVRDTIGAGDAFLSAVVHGLLEDRQPIDAILRFAAQLAGLVAASEGATPPYALDASGTLLR